MCNHLNLDITLISSRFEISISKVEESTSVYLKDCRRITHFNESF